jgi:hypothetical protein
VSAMFSVRGVLSVCLQWVDSNSGVIRVECTSAVPCTVRMDNEHCLYEKPRHRAYTMCRSMLTRTAQAAGTNTMMTRCVNAACLQVLL